MQKHYSVPALAVVAMLASACNQGEATATDPATSPAPSVSDSSTSTPLANDELVRVNDDVITKQLYAAFYSERMRLQPGKKDSPQQQLAALNELTRYVLIADDAKKQGLADREDVKVMLRLQNIRLLAQVAIQERMKDKIPSDDELKKMYEDKIANNPGKEFKARHILVKSEDEAKEIITELNHGAAFAELARSKSVGPSAPSGGDLGWFEPSRMVKPFSDAVVALNDGSYTSEPVKTRFGWHVILREETKELPVPGFADAKGDLIKEIRQQALQDYTIELRDKAKIETVGMQAGAPTQP